MTLKYCECGCGRPIRTGRFSVLCRRAQHRAYYAENPEPIKAHARRLGKEYRRRLRAEALAAYGGSCVCCGEGTSEFLAIDHVKGGGAKHRREVGSGANFYRWLKRNDYPSGFRVLCHNCNQARGAFGYCPHEIDREEAI